MFELEYTFEELPLMIDLGFEGAGVSGKAEIAYFDDGEWSVENVYLDGHKEVRVNGKFDGFEHRLMEVDDHSGWLYRAIWWQLTEGRFKDHIQDAVNEALDGSGIPYRSDRFEHSTHHAALSGVA